MKSLHLCIQIFPECLLCARHFLDAWVIKVNNGHEILIWKSRKYTSKTRVIGVRKKIKQCYIRELLKWFGYLHWVFGEGFS